MAIRQDIAINRIKKFFFQEKRMPTYEETASLFGYQSKGAAYKVIAKFIDEGLLGKDEKGKLFPKNLFAIPHLGNIKAGLPMPAFDSRNDSIDVYRYLQNATGDVYFLTVSGDSMIDAFIADGDKVIVDKHREPVNGDIVAAVVDNEWTIKYFEKKTERVALVPANKNYKIIYPKESLYIGGVVISVIRKYH